MGFFADNVRALRDRQYKHLPNETAKNKALAKDAHTSLSQVQRIIAEELAAGIDIVERIASAFEVRPQDLMTPYFASEALAALAKQAPSPAEIHNFENKNRDKFLQTPTS